MSGNVQRGRLIAAAPIRKKLVRLRTDNHITQTELAKYMGVSQPAVWSMEKGKGTMIRVGTVRSWSAALDELIGHRQQTLPLGV